MLVRKPARLVLFILLTAALALTSCNMGATPAPTTDINAISTAAYLTAVAQVSGGQTQTALAAPSATSAPTNTSLALATFPAANGSAVPGANPALPTVSFNANPNTTPLAGFTPLASQAAPASGAPTAALGDACNNAVFEGDVTVPDGSEIKPGVNFAKTWAIRNTGTCTWDDGYTLVFIGGDKAIDPYDYKFSKTSDKDFVGPGEGINITINLTAPCTPGKYGGTWRLRNDKGYYFGTYLSVSFVVTEKDKKCGK
ncbi:MAG TPA: NBR1-Ig-like domain-containing protein [Anaerolineales bacterium]|nr:NBR1-Ig-like domain-containing protein [Anaerolineales bacterium]